jgi:hypothetical protein
MRGPAFLVRAVATSGSNRTFRGQEWLTLPRLKPGRILRWWAPLEVFQGLDRDGWVLYIGTFSPRMGRRTARACQRPSSWRPAIT